MVGRAAFSPPLFYGMRTFCGGLRASRPTCVMRFFACIFGDFVIIYMIINEEKEEFA